MEKAIHILPESIASQIAAGEVVERPASVVKELVENAIDAGAKSISVETRKAGKALIRVTDDGSGIFADQLLLALSPHATSKLSTAEDLFAIKTLGFRGEALASIASVARLSLSSKRAESNTGAKVVSDGGAINPVQPVALPEGTVVQVEDLFFTLPARLKFLKSDNTENQHVTGLITRYAMAYPQIRWSLVQDDRLVFQTTGSGQREEILQALFGAQDAKELLPISFHEKEFALEGFVSTLSLTRSNRRDITLFVNGRWVQDTALASAVIRAYNTMLMVGRYPVVILFIELPGELVDVNVHPSKAEVRFRDNDLVFGSVQRAIRRGLLAYTPVPDLTSMGLWGQARASGLPTSLAGSAYQPAPNGIPSPKNWGAGDDAYPPSSAHEAPGTDHTTNATQAPQANLFGERLPILRLVGQVASTYLIAEGPDGLYLIDQHAAHERVLFDQMMAQFKAHAIPSQALLQAVTVELTSEKSAILEEHLAVMQSLGFGLEAFGPNTWILRSLPAILAKSEPRDAIYAVVNAFEEDEAPLQAEIEALVAARVCKRMAVKGGQTLSEAEQKSLLMNLEASQSPRTCPHGRPTMIHLSASLLERQFGRSGPR